MTCKHSAGYNGGMGCDIHSYAEKRIDGRWTAVWDGPFDWRSYGMFGFLANVRNYSCVPSLSDNRGMPDDTDSVFSEYSQYHSHTWVSVSELTGFDYSATFEDRRCEREEGGIINCAAVCAPGEGKQITFRDFLGESFFRDLKKLVEIGAERVVLAFDS